MTLTVKRQSLV